MPKLSISLITYNHEQYIAEALDSILSQETGFEYEIVIGEDYSTDRTRSIIEEYHAKHPDKIRLIDRGKNVGSTKNFFDTLLQCRGDYIAMLDGDDVMLPGKLKQQVDFLDTHTDHVMVAHSLLEFDDATGKTLRIVKPAVEKETYLLEDFLRKGSIFGNSSKMFRRSAISFSDSNQQIHFIADMYLTLMVVGTGKVGWLNEVLGKYRRHPGALMRNLKGEKVYEDEVYTLESVKSKFGNTYERFFAPRMAHASLAFGMHEIVDGNKRKGRRKIMESIRFKPDLAISQYVFLVLSFLPMAVVRQYNKIYKIK
jgi:glycosyltransferase involved in cell wall biosynthesis